MQVGGYATSEPVIAWWLDVKGIGESLRELYQVPDKLTPKLLKLVRKLDAIEGRQLLRYSGSRLDRYDQELLDKQMRRLSPPRNDGAIAALLATTFLVGMALGGVLF